MFRGEIWEAELIKNEGSVQGGRRLVIVVQNNMGNRASSTVTIVPFTSAYRKAIAPHYMVKKNKINRLSYDSTALSENITTIPKKRMLHKCGNMTEEDMKELEHRIKIQLGLVDLRKECV